MAMAVGGRGSIKSDINVTPLVDVVLVLLIIFMVMTPLLSRKFWVHTPKQEKQEVQKQIKESEERYIAKNDSAVDELKGIMDRFNEQIRAFNAKRKAEKEKSGG